MSAPRGPRILALVLALLDMAALAAAVRVAWVLRFRYELGALESVQEAPFEEYLKPLVVLLLIVPLLLRMQGLYRTDGLPEPIDIANAVLRSMAVGTVVVLALTFFLRREGFQYSRLTFAYAWAISTVSVAALHIAFRALLVARRRAGKDLLRTVIVGTPSGYLLEKLRTDASFGVDVIGYVGKKPRGLHREGGDGDADGHGHEHEAREGEKALTDSGKLAVGGDSGGAGTLVRSAVVARRGGPLADLPRLGAVSDLRAVLEKGDLHQAILCDPTLTHKALLEAIDACEHAGISARLVPPIYDLLVDATDLAYVDGVPLMRIDEARFHHLGRLWKRLFDIAVSGALLVALSPLLLVATAVIRGGSRGPAIFVQMRAGVGGKPFRMYKFRTMVADAERRLAEVVDVSRLAEPVFKVKDDPRVTPIGRLLRRLSLDELPQLVNVLKGDMSIVGPRPEETRMVERYDVWQRRRLKVKPGITGLQQVTARGSLSNLNERVRLDVYYIRKQSFLLDVWIILRTFGVVLSGRGAS